MIINEPSGDKIIVISVQGILTLFLSIEAKKEFRARQDLEAVGPRTARHIAYTVVDIIGNGDLEVIELNISGTKLVKDTLRDSNGLIRLGEPVDALISTNAADAEVLKGGKQPGHKGRRLDNVVVGHNSNYSTNFRQGLVNLKTFISYRGRVDVYCGKSDTTSDTRDASVFIGRSNENYIAGPAGYYTLESRS